MIKLIFLTWHWKSSELNVPAVDLKVTCILGVPSGDIEFESPRTSRSLGYLNTIASETSTEDELAAEVTFHTSAAATRGGATTTRGGAKPRLVHHLPGAGPGAGGGGGVQPKIIVDFRPIEPMPTSPSARQKTPHKSTTTNTTTGKPPASLGVSPSRSVDRIPPRSPRVSSKTHQFVQEARELYNSHFFGAPYSITSLHHDSNNGDNSVLHSEYDEFDEPATPGGGDDVHHHHHQRHHHHSHINAAQEVYNKSSSFWKSYHAPQIMTASSHPSNAAGGATRRATELVVPSVGDGVGVGAPSGSDGVGVDKDKYKLRPTLQTPPFPTDLTLNPKLAVYSDGAARGVPVSVGPTPRGRKPSVEQDSVYEGASSSSVITDTENRDSDVLMQRGQQQDQSQNSSLKTSTSSTVTGTVVEGEIGGTEREQYQRHSRNSSHPLFGATNTTTTINTDIPDPPSYRQVFPDVQIQSEHTRSQQRQKQQQQQQKKDFSCCSLGRDLQKQQQLYGPLDPPEVKQETEVRPDVTQGGSTGRSSSTKSPPGSPNKKRHSRHQRSNSTPFPSPCNFIDLLADDPNTPTDPYNHYHVTTSQPSLANATSADRISNHSGVYHDFSNNSNSSGSGGRKVPVTSSSAGNIPTEGVTMATTTSDSEVKEESATLGKQPKKPRYIKHKKSPSSHSFGAISSGFTTSSSSGTTFA